jgi:hypothetical protein
MIEHTSLVAEWIRREKMVEEGSYYLLTIAPPSRRWHEMLIVEI